MRTMISYDIVLYAIPQRGTPDTSATITRGCAESRWEGGRGHDAGGRATERLLPHGFAVIL